MDYTVIKSFRKSISMMVDEHGKLIIKAPRFVSKAYIDRFVEQKESWILKQKAKVKKGIVAKKDFVEEEEFFFLGEKYPLKFVDSKKRLDLSDSFCMSKVYQDKAKLIFEKWYKTEARKYFLDRLVFFCDEYGFKFNSLKLSSAKTRWGSCSTLGNINLNWKLILAPEDVVDYVIIHELVHTKVHNHSRKFWDKVGDIIPDYKKHRKWLKDEGRSLTF